MRPKTESALCAAFADKARSSGWTVFPEVAGWDLALVRDDVQVGIEAKVSCSWRALAQAVERRDRAVRRPHHVAVLVARHDEGFADLARTLGLGHYSWEDDVRRVTAEVEVRGKRVRDAEGLRLPTVPLQDTGGRPSPRRLTQWRENAIRVAVALEKGMVSGHEFDRLRLSRTFFLRAGWMEPAPRPGTESGARRSQVWDARDGRRRIVYRRRPSPYRRPWPTEGYEAERDLIVAHDLEHGNHVQNFGERETET